MRGMKSINKQSGPFLAFDAQWFARHQRGLLWLCNAPLVRLWFRWILRIHRDLPTSTRIAQIRPNCITYGARRTAEGVELKTDFRAHVKFAKRIYYAFRPLWWAIHFWDWLVADRFLPQLSYGFDTLTAYPAAGASSPVDGIAGRFSSNSSLSTLRSSAGTYSSATDSPFLLLSVGGSTTNLFAGCYRFIMCFDTSALTAGATLSSAVLSLYGRSGSTNGLGSDNIHIVASTPASTSSLSTSDYNQLGTTSFGSMAYGSWSGSAYNDITLNSSGLSNISKTSISKFGSTLGWDLNNSFTGTWVAFGTTGYNFNSADTAGTSSDPKLVVTYTMASTARNGDFFFPFAGV